MLIRLAATTCTCSKQLDALMRSTSLFVLQPLPFTQALPASLNINCSLFSEASISGSFSTPHWDFFGGCDKIGACQCSVLFSISEHSYIHVHTTEQWSK